MYVCVGSYPPYQGTGEDDGGENEVSELVQLTTRPWCDITQKSKGKISTLCMLPAKYFEDYNRTKKLSSQNLDG